LSQNGTYERLYQARFPVKLGESAFYQNMISEDAFERGLSAFSAFKQKINEHKVDKVLAYATSAIRDALNGGNFTSEVREHFDINIEVIDGDREAELVYLGVREAVTLNENVSMIMDIGGGSTEFILANKFQILWKKSFNIGAARILRRFNPSDPISLKEIDSINKYLESGLTSLFEAQKKYSAIELIGSSGGFESLIEMIHGELGGEPFTVAKTEYKVDLNNYTAISNRILDSTLAERKAISSLVPMRQDMIVIFCIMVNFVLRKFGLTTLRVSDFSLKEGVIIDYLNKKDKNIIF
jgi:exopolyphosphatase/guanosine-5'-triphosphate,3'-diphosphate pyrophosphatase